MNTELSKELTRALKSLNDGVEVGIDEFPQLCEELVRLGELYFYISLVAVVIGLVALIGGAITAIRTCDENSPWFPVGMFTWIFAGLPGVVLGGANACYYVQALFAPKVYVVQELMNLLK